MTRPAPTASGPSAPSTTSVPSTPTTSKPPASSPVPNRGCPSCSSTPRRGSSSQSPRSPARRWVSRARTLSPWRPAGASSSPRCGSGRRPGRTRRKESSPQHGEEVGAAQGSDAEQLKCGPHPALVRGQDRRPATTASLRQCQVCAPGRRPPGRRRAEQQPRPSLIGHQGGNAHGRGSSLAALPQRITCAHPGGTGRQPGLWGGCRWIQGVRSSTRTRSPAHRCGAVVAMIAPSGRSGVGWAAYWLCAAAQVSCRARARAAARSRSTDDPPHPGLDLAPAGERQRRRGAAGCGRGTLGLAAGETPARLPGAAGRCSRSSG